MKGNFLPRYICPAESIEKRGRCFHKKGADFFCPFCHSMKNVNSPVPCTENQYNLLFEKFNW